MDLPPFHFIAIVFAAMPLGLAAGIFGGTWLWYRAFRSLQPGAPAPDQITEVEAREFERSLGNVSKSAKALKGALMILALITALVALGYLVHTRL